MKVKCWMRIFLFTLLLRPFALFAWWDMGHMLVAEVARLQISPKTYKEVDQLVKKFAEDFPHSNDMVTAACWADDIKQEDFLAMNLWHFNESPFDPEHYLSDERKNFLDGQLKIVGVNFALEEALHTLRSPKAGSWVKGVMLRVLLHMMGDLHQPLHMGSFYSSQFANGNVGGNAFPLKGEFEQLHSLWDAGGGAYAHRIHRPLSAQDREFLEKKARELLQRYPKESLETSLSKKGLKAWGEETFDLFPQVYEGIKADELPSDQYIQKVQDMASRQIVLAGYRLAILLQEIFDSTKANP